MGAFLTASLFLSFIELSLFRPCQTTSTTPPPSFALPKSRALSFVNLLIGNGGDTPNGSGGMIPSTSPPFGMTRWVAQTQPHFVSATPFNWTHGRIMGVVGTRQPAIWMGDSAPISVSAAVGGLEGMITDFDGRGLVVTMDEDGEKNEVVSVGYYSVELDDGHGGTILVEQTATSRVAHLRFTFVNSTLPPRLLFEVARPSVLTSTPTNITYPSASVTFHSPLEICGWSDERQDRIITPISTAPFSEHFKGYFCARFDSDTILPSFGVISDDATTFPFVNVTTSKGPLHAFALFPRPTPGVNTTVTLRVGTSFISEEHARLNIDHEIPNRRRRPEPKPFANNVVPVETTAQAVAALPETDNEDVPPNMFDPGTFENTAYLVRKSWTDLLKKIDVLPYASDPGHKRLSQRDIIDLETFWTGVVHTLQYPSEQSEHGSYFSGYTNSTHSGTSYTGYSIWDTYRAQWAWQILFIPERVSGMVRSMLQDYQQSGWLPMWKNVVETNIMIGTHADSLIAEAVLKNITDFDLELAWEAVWKDSTVPPERDWEVQYADREEHVDYEVRAGLSSVYNVEGKGWVADDIHSESASRTLAFAYDDYAASTLSALLSKPDNTTRFLRKRAYQAPWTLWNNETGFIEAKNLNGSWAGEDRGWTEGDKWAYTFDVVHNIPELIERRGGKVGFVKSLEEHFDGGHNEHSNEPSHHLPYLYSLSGAAWKTQERVRQIARENYDNTPTGLSGNEDCGQMSAWYIFSAMGFYPVNPVSGTYVVGSPFFERITLHLSQPVPSSTSNSTTTWVDRQLRIIAIGARTKPYVKSLAIDGLKIKGPLIRHEWLFGALRSASQLDDVAGGEDYVDAEVGYSSRDMDGQRQSSKKPKPKPRPRVTEVVFEMSDQVEEWGNDPEVLEALGVVLSRNGDGEQFVLQSPPRREEL